MASNQFPVCVSIGPFGKTAEEQRHRSELESALRAATKNKYSFTPFTELAEIDMPLGLFSGLVNASLVIADLHGLNPNVMYEVGIRHAFNKPIILLIPDGEDIPWDVDKNHCIKYAYPLSTNGKNDLIHKISAKIPALENLKIGGYSTFYNTINYAAFLDTEKAAEEIKQTLGAIRSLLAVMPGAKPDILAVVGTDGLMRHFNGTSTCTGEMMQNSGQSKTK